MSVVGGKKVFLADVSSEMEKYKAGLIKELNNYGCEIYELSEPLSADSITTVLEDCQLAIHLLSDTDFEIGKNKKGKEEEQLVLAVNHCVGRKLMAAYEEEAFRVIAWHPKPVSEDIYEEEKLSTHLMRIQQLEDVEFLRTTYEDFKSYLIRQIQTSKTYAPDTHFIKDDPNHSIFFVYDPVDRVQALRYIDFMSRRGYTVLSPKLEGDIMQARQDYNNHLKLFDVAIIFAVQVSVNWVNMKLMDVLKSPGMGREKEILAKAVMMSPAKKTHCPLINRGFDIIEPTDEDFSTGLENYLKNLPVK